MKRRANIAASILQNPQMLEDVYKSSQEAAGSAEEELSKSLDSIEGENLPYYAEMHIRNISNCR